MKTISEIMTTDVYRAQADWSLDTLSQFFFDKQVSGAPVVDNGDQLVGVVSLTDMARNTTVPVIGSSDTERHNYYHDMKFAGISREDMELLKAESESITVVKDIMTPLVYDVPRDATIMDTAQLMLKGHIHRVLVTNNKKLVGIVTTMDMLKVIVNNQ
ncbi:MAG: CBS domain-containing protein [Gammaproteobacteria bacterium]|jgi:predicted transcriptional regulator